MGTELLTKLSLELLKALNYKGTAINIVSSYLYF